MNNQLLIVQYDRKQRSVDLMDQFEQRDEQGAPVNTILLLQNLFCVCIADTSYYADMLIERKPYEMPWGGIGITFTRLRKEIASHTFRLDEAETIDPVTQLLYKLKQNQRLREVSLEPGHSESAEQLEPNRLWALLTGRAILWRDEPIHYNYDLSASVAGTSERSYCAIPKQNLFTI